MRPDAPIAFFITWTCYGTWLPGDERGWTRWHKGDEVANAKLAAWCEGQMKEECVILDQEQRQIANQVVEDHCRHRSWILHHVNCRSNHCHVVVTAHGYHGEVVRDQFKFWGKRRLKEHQGITGEASIREAWWTRKGSVRYLFDDLSLEAAAEYAGEAQELGGSKGNS